MNYRFLHVASFYPALVQQVMDELPMGTSLTYQEVHEKLVKTRFGWSDFFVRHFDELGNPSELIIITEVLQRLWALENGVSFKSTITDLKKIVMTQICAAKPDVILFEDLKVCDASFRAELRKKLGRMPLFLGWHAAPLDNYSIFNDLNMILTAAPHFIDRFENAGAKAELMFLAFEDSLLDEISHEEKKHDLTFSGSFVLGAGYHSQRILLLLELLKNSPLQIWGDIPDEIHNPPAVIRYLKKFRLSRVILKKIETVANLPGIKSLNFSNRISGRHIKTEIADLPVKQRYPDRIHSSVFGRDYFKLLAESHISLNNHIDVAEDYCCNMRMYEATGMGSCLLTDWKRNLPELFMPDVEVVTYRNSEEAREKALYLLAHPDEMRAIAIAGQRRTLKDHTYKNRTIQLDQIIQTLFKNA